MILPKLKQKWPESLEFCFTFLVHHPNETYNHEIQVRKYMEEEGNQKNSIFCIHMSCSNFVLTTIIVSLNEMYRNLALKFSYLMMKVFFCGNSPSY